MGTQLPNKLLQLADVEIPSELHSVLQEAAEVNQNYSPDNLPESLQKEILAALKYPKQAPSKIQMLAMRIKARAGQIVELNNSLWASGKKFEPSTQSDFKAGSRCSAKSLQEVLTAPEDRVANKFNNRRGSREEQEERETSDREDLPRIIIDPELISNQTLIQLGLGEFLARPRARAIERLQAKIDVIEHVRAKVLSALEPIPMSSRGSPENSYRLFRLTEESSKSGAILRTQENAGKDRIAVLDLYGVKRSIEHIERLYRVEIKKIEEIAAKLEEIDDELTNWKESKSEENIKAMMAKLKVMISELYGVTNKAKARLCYKIANALRMLKVKNPTAARAAVDQVSRNILIDYRESEIVNIFKYLSADKKVVENHINKEIQSINGLYTKVEEQNSDPRLGNPDAPLNKAEVDALLNRLKKLRDSSAKVIFLPNLPFAQKLSAYIDATMEALESETPDREMVAEYFMRAYVTSKLAFYYQSLLNIYESFSVHGSKGLDVRTWLITLDSISSQLNKIGKGKTVYTREFNKIWTEVREMEEKLRPALNEYGEAKIEDKPKCVTQIKNIISKINLPKLVASLQVPTPEQIREENAKAITASLARKPATDA